MEGAGVSFAGQAESAVAMPGKLLPYAIWRLLPQIAGGTQLAGRLDPPLGAVYQVEMASFLAGYPVAVRGLYPRRDQTGDPLLREIADGRISFASPQAGLRVAGDR